jgi:hypothetical protein
MFRVHMILKTAALVFAAMFLGSTHAQVVDLSFDKNKNGTSVTTFVLAGEPVDKVSAIFIADSTGYGEVVVGTALRFGNLTVAPHVGIEWVKGIDPKARALILTSLPLGKFTFDNVNEFGGVTGNFYKTTLGYQVSERWKTSLVYHSVAGAGGRLDFTVPVAGAGGYTVYVQILERRQTGGLAFAVKF